jgi:Icc-related predicted phosphoesterase
MKIYALSDLHGTLLPVEDYFKPCELVCICGDISPLNIQGNYTQMRYWLVNKFKPWCESLPCDKVIFIAGNHDFGCSNLDFMYTLFPKDKKVTYLFHENYVYTSKSGKEYSIFGTPYCKLFGNWAFMEIDEILDKLYQDIPENLDILLTHDQPFGWGDVLFDNVVWNTGEHIGNKPLAKAIIQKQPKYLFVGHLHSTDHSCIEIGETKRYNVSIKNEKYDPVYDPLFLEI